MKANIILCMKEHNFKGNQKYQLEKKKIDGFCHDEPTIKYIMRSHDKIEYLTTKNAEKVLENK